MSPQDRRTLRIGLLGFVVAVTLILGAWRIVASDLPDFRAAAPLPTGTPMSEATVSRTPTETFVVPSPPPVTPTVTASASPTSDDPTPDAAPVVAAAPPPPPAARNAAPPQQPIPSAPQVRNIELSCSQNGRRIAATFTFRSDAPVGVALTAGGRTETSRGSGAVHMHVSGPGGPDASCSAVVDGRQVGPVPSGHRR